MATKLENLKLELAHFNNFKHYLPEFKHWCPVTVNQIGSHYGGLQVSTFFEHVVAILGGTTVVSQDSHDLSNGDDCKLSTVRTSSNGTNYSAPVSNIAGKTGTLRVQVYERKLDKFYYFAIPRAAYMHIPEKSNIEIPFFLDGTPKKQNNCKVNWWKFAEPTFVDMATIQY